MFAAIGAMMWGKGKIVLQSSFPVRSDRLCQIGAGSGAGGGAWWSLFSCILRMHLPQRCTSFFAISRLALSSWYSDPCGQKLVAQWVYLSVDGFPLGERLPGQSWVSRYSLNLWHLLPGLAHNNHSEEAYRVNGTCFLFFPFCDNNARHLHVIE